MIQQNTETVPAHAYAAEQVLLALMLRDESFVPKLRRLLTPQDFFTPQHQLICAAIFGAADKGQFFLMPVGDLLAERSELSRVGRGPDPADGRDYLAYLHIEQYYDTANFDYYAAQVRKAADHRNFVSLTTKLARDAESALPGDLNAVLAQHQSELAGLDRHYADDVVEIGADIDATIEQANRVRDGLATTGVLTGFQVIDEITGGLGCGDIWLVGGATSIGKSSFGLAVTANILKAGGRVLYVSREMQRSAVATRLLGSEARISGLTLRRGDLTNEEENSRAAAVEEIARWRLVVDDRASRVAEIALRIDDLSSHWGQPPSLLCVDYIQLLQPQKGRSRVEEISDLMWSLKSLAMKSGVPILALSQLNRESVKTGNPPPLHALRECGDLENMSNLCLLLHRPSPPEFDSGGGVVLWGKIAKSRDGAVTAWPTPTTRESGIRFRFLPEFACIEPLTLSLEGR